MAGGAFADAESVGDGDHGERLGGGEEEAVNLAVGAGIAEEVGEFGEDIDEDFFEAGLGVCRGADGGGLGHGELLWHGGEASSIQNESFFRGRVEFLKCGNLRLAERGAAG